MKAIPEVETTRALHIIFRHQRACEEPSYQRFLRRESKKNVYLTSESKIDSLKQMVRRDYAIHGTVDHPRLWTLRSRDDSAVQKNLGTPPVPRSDSQDQLPPRPLAEAAEDEASALRLNQLVDELDLALRTT
ncbi:hypothetical protein PTTG_25522 [Puccinia triticina 1-1 BBBD Race 1]|uniref:Uncharacterized protein n=1 Tax=Puccinia triticina (isolate 1-1 / race 1 (BBBD)) TaxID=630390 RepID=A0A180H214_PUCT1|nr:hypothetical protein PTTG_25522 [Puccinia triticina 1-1 BBBD Race 1]